MIKLYTIGCPACNVLERKLQAKGVEYTKVEEESIFAEKGITIFPQLELEDGTTLGLKDANHWLKQLEG